MEAVLEATVEAEETAPLGAPSGRGQPRVTKPEVEHLAFRYRLMPTAEQARMFHQISGCGRWVYNQALELCQKARAAGEPVPSVFTLHKQLPVWKRAHAFLREPPSHTLQAAIADLGDAWSRFFKGQNDAPTWRRHGEAPSFRLKDPNQFVIRNLPGTKKTTRHLFLPKMGMSGSLGPVAFVQHRPIEGKVKHLTISRDGGMWVVSFSVERKVRPEVHAQRARVARLIEVGAFGGRPGFGVPTPEAVGSLGSPTLLAFGPQLVALGPHPLVVTGVDRNTPANGSCVTNWGDVYGAQVRTRAREKKLADLQRVVARKEEAFRKANGIAPGGSLKPLRMKGIEEPKALRNARAELAAFHGYLARCRKDLAHKTSRSIARVSDVVGVEALGTKEMTAAPGTVLADGSVKVPTVSKGVRKDILDAGWAMTESMLAYKLARAGKRLVRVDPAYTSQTCSACGHVEAKNRNGKVFRCVACGHTMDADVNAAVNVRARAIAGLVAEVKMEAKPKGAPKVAKEEQTGTAGSAGVAPGGFHKESDEGRKSTAVVEGRQALEKPQRAAAG